MSDLIYTEPKYTECADTAVVTRGIQNNSRQFSDQLR